MQPKNSSNVNNLDKNETKTIKKNINTNQINNNQTIETNLNKNIIINNTAQKINLNSTISTNNDSINQINNSINKSTVKIISLNTNGMKSNATYINELIEENDIVLFLETWHEKLDEFDKILYKNFKIKKYTKLATRVFKTGRASGGMVFVVKESLESSCNFYNDRIGILTIGNTVIIGVYDLRRWKQ